MGNGPINKYAQTKVHLSQNAYAVVTKATEKSTGKNWAMKTFDKQGDYNREMVMKEVNTLRLCKHYNITRLREYFETSSATYLILEFYEIGELSDRIKQKGHQLEEKEAASWVHQILRALEHLMEQRVVHRDIKPSSFVFHDTDNLKLTDFGWAEVVNEGQMLKEAKGGTDAFKAPEFFDDATRQKESYSFPVDMWGAGLTFVAIMTGQGVIHGPFYNEDTRELNKADLMKGDLAFLRVQDQSSVLGWAAAKLDETMQAAISTATPRLGPGAKTLCRKMVEPDQSKRVIPKEALADDWFKETDPAKAPENWGQEPTMKGAHSSSGWSGYEAQKAKCCAIS